MKLLLKFSASLKKVKKKKKRKKTRCLNVDLRTNCSPKMFSNFTGCLQICLDRPELKTNSGKTVVYCVKNDRQYMKIYTDY